MSSRVMLSDPDLIERIHEIVGYTPPRPFLEILGRLNQLARTTEPEATTEEIGMGWIGGAIDLRYHLTPPEVFVFGNMGVDGVHFGHVNPAPEFEWPDLPFVQCDPCERVVTLVGGDAATTFERMLVEQVEFRLGYYAEHPDGSDPEEAARTRRIAAALGFGDAVEAAAREAEDKRLALETEDEDEIPQRNEALETSSSRGAESIAYLVPRGWRHVPTLDGVGVVAPADAFRLDPVQRCVPADPEKADPAPLLDSARRLAADHPASALVEFKDWFSARGSHDAGEPAAIREMAECYVRLGRPRLAAHALLSAGLREEAAPLLRRP